MGTASDRLNNAAALRTLLEPGLLPGGACPRAGAHRRVRGVRLPALHPAAAGCLEARGAFQPHTATGGWRRYAGGRSRCRGVAVAAGAEAGAAITNVGAHGRGAASAPTPTGPPTG